MDRSFEEIRAEVFDLDRESQQKLEEDLERRWSADVDEAAFDEASKRLEAYSRGEMTAASAEVALGRVRKMIETKADRKK